MSSIEKYLADKLLERKQDGNFRHLSIPHLGIDFSSNDYIGIARSAVFHKAILAEIESQNFPTIGATGSRLLSGNHSYTLSLENEIAGFHLAEKCLLFNSGFDANYGLLSTLPRADDLIVMDELVHASIHDGARASKAAKLFFKHNDIAALEQILAKAKNRLKYVVIESLYSMEGDWAAVEDIFTICEKYDAQLIVDEAHATGVIGEKGEGICQLLGVEKRVFARIVTFGKAIGVHGACILGAENLISFLINYCRPFIFSTALPSHSLAAIKVAYQFFPAMEEERKKLQQLSTYFDEKMGEKKTAFSPINKICVAGNEAVIRLSQRLQQASIDARAIRYPTVAKGEERIRICLHSYNTADDIDLLFENM